MFAPNRTGIVLFSLQQPVAFHDSEVFHDGAVPARSTVLSH
jgi:hypothetical protein